MIEYERWREITGMQSTAAFLRLRQQTHAVPETHTQLNISPSGTRFLRQRWHGSLEVTVSSASLFVFLFLEVGGGE